jgi:hypothetical protein
VEELNTILKNKSKNISDFCNKLNTKLNDIEINENEVYSSLDTLLEEDNLSNIDKKVLSKKKLVGHLTTSKQTNEDLSSDVVVNESLLHAVLVNNFNVLYSNNLNEEQKEELKNILSMNQEDLDKNMSELKENVLDQVSKILTENSDQDLSKKLTQVQDEVNKMTFSKINYFKLKELKNGLN